MEGLRVPPTAPRLATVRSAQALVSDLANAPNPVATVEVLAGATLETSEAAVARLLAAVQDLCGAVTAASWDIIEKAMGLADHRRAAAETLREKLSEVLEADEHALALKPALRDLQVRATRLLADTSDQHEQPSAASTATASAVTSANSGRRDRGRPAADRGSTRPRPSAALDRLRDRVTAEPESKLDDLLAARLVRGLEGDG